MTKCQGMLQSTSILLCFLLSIAQILGEYLDEKPGSLSGKYSLLFFIFVNKGPKIPRYREIIIVEKISSSDFF